MKKICLLLSLILLPLVASAEKVEIDGICYILDSQNNTAKVWSKAPQSQYTGNVVIPEVVSYANVQYSVTHIGDNAFYGCNELTSVTIPNSVTMVGVNAFDGCTNLTRVELDNHAIVSKCYYGSGGKINSIFGNQVKEYIIGNNVTSIGEAAFSNCSMTSITIPNTIKRIGSEAFNGCTNLSSVNISDISAWCKIDFNDNPLGLAHHLYLNGEEVKELVIPNDVTNIPYAAFYGCHGLTSVTIPNNVEDVGYWAFYQCVNLTKVELNCSSFLSTEYNSKTSLKNYFGNQVKEYILGESVTKIGNYAFYGCSELTSITIGKKMRSIGNRSFGFCPQLTDVYSFSKIVPNTHPDAFAIANIQGATLYVPATSIPSYKNATPWNNFKNILKIAMPKHKLIYIVDGFVFSSYDIEEDELITPEPIPTREGYTFSGWSEIPETMPDHDVIVTGSFSLDSGIGQIISDENDNTRIFTIDGKRINKLQKGMNVIQMKDGTTHKIVIK